MSALASWTLLELLGSLGSLGQAGAGRRRRRQNPKGLTCAAQGPLPRAHVAAKS